MVHAHADRTKLRANAVLTVATGTGDPLFSVCETYQRLPLLRGATCVNSGHALLRFPGSI